MDSWRASQPLTKPGEIDATWQTKTPVKPSPQQPKVISKVELYSLGVAVGAMVRFFLMAKEEPVRAASESIRRALALFTLWPVLGLSPSLHPNSWFAGLIAVHATLAFRSMIDRGEISPGPFRSSGKTTVDTALASLALITNTVAFAEVVSRLSKTTDIATAALGVLLGFELVLRSGR